MKIKTMIDYFSGTELALWAGSVALIVLSFCVFDRESYLTLAASLIGVTSIIFSAKGNPAGQVLMILFSLLYGYISYSFAYYGEMMTYLGMTMPMAGAALVTWLRHPYEGKRSEVAVNRVSGTELLFMAALICRAAEHMSCRACAMKRRPSRLLENTYKNAGICL